MRTLGADLGATWLRAVLVDEGRILWRERLPAVDRRRAAAALAGVLKRRRAGRPDLLVLGGTRLGAAKPRAELARALRPLARRVRVTTDFEIAHAAAFGRGPGVLLVASTGSIAYARGPRGAKRAGGLGPLLGDEGSGFWLGREAARDPRLRRALRLPHPLALAHAADPVRATAALAPRVLRARAAARLKRAAAGHLAALAREASRGLGLPRPMPLALHGSLFKDAGLRRAVLRALAPCRAVPPRVRAEDAAAGLSDRARIS